MGNTTNGVLMGVAGFLAFVGLVANSVMELLCALVLLSFTRILQEWKK